MKEIILIDNSLSQFNGNLHTHSTRSDGKFSVDEVKHMYRDAGFHFVCMTDHEIYFDTDEYDEPGFLMMGGCESSVRMNENYKWIIDYRKSPSDPYRTDHRYLHLGLVKDYCSDAEGFANDQKVERLLDRGLDSWNSFIADVREKGNFVFVNHPFWSRMNREDLLAMQGVTAMEVFNSEVVHGCGGETDESIWDWCLCKGRRILAVAADDFHGKAQLCGRGMTVVLAKSLDRQSISDALANGRFYASCGPRMYSMRIENGVLKMVFSPCREVRIVSYDRTGKNIGPTADDALFTEGEWTVDTNMRWFRVELLDEKGRKAWMQPVFMEDLLDE